MGRPVLVGAPFVSPPWPCPSCPALPLLPLLCEAGGCFSEAAPSEVACGCSAPCCSSWPAARQCGYLSEGWHHLNGCVLTLSSAHALIPTDSIFLMW